MNQINFEEFTKEGKHLVSLMEKVNDGGDLNYYINSLSNVLTSSEQDSEILLDKDYSSLHYHIGNILDYDVNNITQNIENSLSILTCVSQIFHHGIITYPNCREMECFKKDDIQKISNILNTPIIYDTDDFIASAKFLKDCNRTVPSNKS
jgi:hypothetical protein